jgi:peroxiredoxin
MRSSAAPNVRFVTTAGTTLSTSEVVARGKGLPVLLAFFKTSCPVCQLAWPYLERIHQAYGGKAVHVVGVSQNEAGESERFFEEYGRARFDLLLDPEPRFDASNGFDVEAVPHLALVSPAGVLEETFEGWSKTKMEALGKRLAKGKGLPPVPVVPPGDPVRDSSTG